MAGKTPVHEGIKRQLKERIEGGGYAVGARLPSEIEWARTLGVSRNRTRQALHELELEGLIVRRQGSGSFVAPRPGHVSILPEDSAKKTVGIVFPHYGSGYFQQVINGFLQRMSTPEMPTIAYNSHSDRSAEPGFLASMCENGLSGLAIWLEYDSPEARDVLRRQQERRFPIVFVDRCPAGIDFDFVVSDNVEIGHQLTTALVERGHQRVAFLGTQSADPSSVAERYAGYRRALEEASIEPDDRLLMDMDRFRESPPETTKDILALCDRPTGFVCVHDGVAVRLHEELVTLGYQVPGNAELATVDDDHCGTYSIHVPLWTVVQDGLTIGATAADLLLRRMAETDAPVQQRVVAPGDVRYVECQVGQERGVYAENGGGSPHEVATMRQELQ